MQRFAQVHWLPWGELPAERIGPDDFLITHPRNLQNAIEMASLAPFVQAKAKLILFGNLSLLSEKWQTGGYSLHGYKLNYFQGQEHAISAGVGVQDIVGAQVEYAVATIWKSNDVAIRKWENDHPDIIAGKQWVTARQVDWTSIPHPIDKKKFHREVFNSERKKFFVLPGSEPNKRQQVFRAIVGEGNCVLASGVNWFDPASYAPVIRECSFVGQISLQEGFPYFVNEALCKGLLPICGEDWWDGYGYETLIWRQDAAGKTDAENRQKVKFLLSENVESMYQEVIQKHLSRTNNDWAYALDLIGQKIARYS